MRVECERLAPQRVWTLACVEIGLCEITRKQPPNDVIVGDLYDIVLGKAGDFQIEKVPISQN